MMFLLLSVEVLLLTAVAVYNMTKLLDMEYFTDYLLEKSKTARNPDGPHREALLEWTEALLNMGEKGLAVRSLSQLQKMRLAGQEVLKALLDKAPHRVAADPLWYEVANYVWEENEDSKQ